MSAAKSALEIVENALDLALADATNPRSRNSRDRMAILNLIRRHLGGDITIAIKDPELEKKLSQMQEDKTQRENWARNSHITHI